MAENSSKAYDKEMLKSMREMAKPNSGHCEGFRNQCKREIPKIEKRLRDARR